MENVKEWIEDNSVSADRGFGFGFGRGNGNGFGRGYGNGFGRGNGNGFGYSNGFGRGNSNSFGHDNGHGSGHDNGNGFGRGFNRGDYLKSFNNMDVYVLDSVQTIITHIKGTFAKGFIVNSDLTLSQCFVAKGNGYFAHGKTLKEARESLMAKIFENMDSDEAVSEFINKFEKSKAYPGTDFFEWHHYLTGSCLMGRESFVKNHGLDLNRYYTVKEFINICENDYGGEIIKKLKEFYE